MKAFALVCLLGLLTSCRTNSYRARKPAPKWDVPLKAALRIDDVPGLSATLAEHSLASDVALNDNGLTPLMLAASLSSVDTARWLLDHGAKANARTTLKNPAQYPEAAGCTPLFMAASRGRTEIVKLLLARGAEVNRPDSRGNTPLIVACAQGHLASAKLLLQHGADLHCQDSYGATALLRAIQHERCEVAQYLLAQGADARAACPSGMDALVLAACTGDVPLVQALFDKGAGENRASLGTALLQAAGEGRTEVVSLLLRKGAPLNAPDKDGWTPLMKSAASGQVDTVKVLCEAGADPTQRNRFGRTARDYARDLPAAAHLGTGSELKNLLLQDTFQQEELAPMLRRQEKDASANYEKVVKLLEDYEQRFHHQKL